MWNVFQPKLYISVIDDVIESMREVFLDEGVEERVLEELRQVRATGSVFIIHFVFNSVSVVQEISISKCSIQTFLNTFTK
uniref:Uncharacterized protein n=1 Tax=Scleropages formosus TaxID=113540 RepID=A0A8C9SVB3_SCLFO